MTAHEFVMAYFLSVLGAIWAWGFLHCLDLRKSRVTQLAKLKEDARKHPNVERVSSKYESACARHYFIELTISAVVLLISGAFIFWIYLGQETYELSSLQGRLYPANDPTPSNPCDHHLKDNKQYHYVVLFGSQAVAVEKFPFTIMKVQDRDLFLINRESDGTIVVSLDIFDANGRVIVVIDKGQFSINPNNYLPKPHRPDRHTLVVYDQYNNQVLKMRYLNKKAITVDAILRVPGVSTPIIFWGSNPTKQPIGMHNNCNIVTEEGSAGFIHISEGPSGATGDIKVLPPLEE